jgi:hypothetical protein
VAKKTPTRSIVRKNKHKEQKTTQRKKEISQMHGYTQSRGAFVRASLSCGLTVARGQENHTKNPSRAAKEKRLLFSLARADSFFIKIYLVKRTGAQ